MNDAIDITTSQRKTVLSLLARHLPDAEVWVYGSRANWTAKSASDLDMVVFTSPEQSRKVADLKEAFEDSSLPFRVDLFVWDDIPDSFKANIKKQHVVLQKKEEQKPLPKGWAYRKVAEIAEVVGGGTPKTKKDDYWGGDIPWLTPKDLSGEHPRYVPHGERNITKAGLENSSARIVPPKTVLLTSRAPVGYVAMAKNPITTNQGFRSLVVNDENDPEFVYYLLLNNTEYLKQHAAGSTFQELSGSTLKSLEFLMPPLPEQKSIAHILGTLDDKIELNRRMNETLEGIARAIFKSWFIDFDPVIDNALRAGNPIPDSMAERAEVRKRLLDQNQPSCFAPSPPPLPEGEEPGEWRKNGHYRGGYDFSGLVEKARELRKTQTPAEDLFWELVRNRRFMGLKFRRQHQLGDYVADFYCHEHRLVIELDGGVHDAQHKKDHKRDAWMQAQGYTVLRFRNEQLLEDPASVLNEIADTFHLNSGSSPFGRGGGEGIVDYHDLFPDTFEPACRDGHGAGRDSELGEIPKGWEAGCLADLSELNPETWKPTTAPERITYVDLANTKNGEINSTQDYSFKDAPSRARRVLRPGDTIVGTVRPGNRSFAYVSVDDLTGSTGFAVLRPKSDTAREFVYLCATQTDSIDHLAHLADGAAYPAVRPDVVHSLPCTVPPNDVLKAFHASVAPLFAGIGSNINNSQTLHAVRDHLLPALLSGKIALPELFFEEMRISEAEIIADKLKL